MTGEKSSFPVGFHFESMLRTISKQIYETPLAFIRENVQNAIDAIRIQAQHDQAEPGDDQYGVVITVDGKTATVRDNGNGMTEADLQNFFWTIGASGKRRPEAIAAGCVGMFGIGGFANFGVCDELEVVSQVEGSTEGTLTRLSRQDIENSGATIPSVTVERSNGATPRGTLVIGQMRNLPNIDELREYLRDFVRFVPIKVTFNGQILSQRKFSDVDDRENLTEIGQSQTWQEGDITIEGRLYEDRGHALVAAINSMIVGDESIGVAGQIRFENGTIDVFKRGFKLCATQIGTSIGVSGRLDCDRFVPTAGRDSLDGSTTSLLGQMLSLLERVAVNAVLQSPERLAQHTRIFKYIINRGLVEKLDGARVSLADGSETLLGSIKARAAQGVGIYYGTSQKYALNQIMQARGHVVVLLSSDRNRREAEKQYLEQQCAAKPFDGVIDCAEVYEKLNRFELVFLSELELAIAKSYEIQNFRLIPGKLTEDIPVFVKESSSGKPMDIYVDVRHTEVSKLEGLGFTQLLYSLIGTFCREYLGPSLKKWSPRFFGDGAINVELLAKRRSELWVLLKDDIGVVHKGGKREVVSRQDVQVVNVGGNVQSQPSPVQKQQPRLLQIVDQGGQADLAGYYIRLPDAAFRAYGDLLPECDSRGLVWVGNKITYNLSDAVSTAFQYEIRLDEVASPEIDGLRRPEGAVELDRPVQELFDGLYFPVPTPLERFLVPKGEDVIRLELHCDWLDMRTAQHWVAQDEAA
jgi:molecular chaperone HtpG